MKTDLITIFNQLTGENELADYSLFSDILENHYEKFKYIYSLIENIDLKKVNKIDCKCGKNKLKVIIDPYEIKYINDIIFYINANRNNYMFADQFILDLTEERDVLKISISMKDDKEEGSLYANRFV